MEQERIIENKLKYKQCTENLVQISELIVDAEVDSNYFNTQFASFQALVDSIGQINNLDMNALTP